MKDASIHLGDAVRWWAEWPDANVGIATGAISGIVVLDVDPRNDGFSSLELLEDRLGHYLPDGPIVLTGGGGVHRYFQYPEGGCPSVGSLFPGIDIKSDGGFVVAPPSSHASGSDYEWNPHFGPEHDLPGIPTPLLAVIRAPKKQSSSPAERGCGNTRELAEALRFPKIRRRFDRDASGLNDTSPSGVDFGLACSLAACGLGQTDIENAILRSREEAGLPPKRFTYIRHTAAKAVEAAA